MSELDLLQQTIAGLSQRIRSREVSPVEVTEAAIAHAERMQPVINSFITLTPELAMAQAQLAERQMARGIYLGPLHGIPMGVKDQFRTKGVRTTDGSKLHEDVVPDDDAPVVERCKAAGAVILGKENMHEIGAGFVGDNPWFGPVRNPWDLSRIAGGSSSGSAANVAAFVTFGSIGSDGGGSVRQPSAICGIVGLKPTFGRVSSGSRGGGDLATGHIGPHTRTVRDCALILHAIAGYDPLDPSSVPVPVEEYQAGLDRDIKGLVMGVPSNHFFDQLDPEIAQSVHDAIEVIEALGVKKRRVEMKYLEYLDTLRRISHSTIAVAYEDDLRNRREKIAFAERFWLLRGQFTPARDFIRAQQLRQRLREEWAKVMQEVDFLVTPTTPTPAWRIGATSIRVDNEEVDVSATPDAKIGWFMGRFTSPGNWTGVPAISVPCGFTSERLPIGLQILGRPWEESLVLRVAHQYEQSSGREQIVPPAVQQTMAGTRVDR